MKTKWEKELKEYMIVLIDEYFPKDNYKDPTKPSTTHRSEAIAAFSMFLIKARILFKEQAEDITIDIQNDCKRELKEQKEKYHQTIDQLVAEKNLYQEQLKQEKSRGVGKNWIKIDTKDIRTIISLLKGKQENQKIINFIKTYIYDDPEE